MWLPSRWGYGKGWRQVYKGLPRTVDHIGINQPRLLTSALEVSYRSQQNLGEFRFVFAFRSALTPPPCPPRVR